MGTSSIIFFPALVLLCASNHLISSYSFQKHVRRYLPKLATAEAYQRCLNGWRTDNFHLPLLPPLILNRGDDITGVGFEIMRIPPFGLREGILDCQVLQVNKNPELLVWNMTYQVLNPGWLTWPVESHIGNVCFSPDSKGNGCVMDWTVKWNPLPHVGPLVNLLTTMVVDVCANYVSQ